MHDARCTGSSLKLIIDRYSLLFGFSNQFFVASFEFEFEGYFIFLMIAQGSSHLDDGIPGSTLIDVDEAERGKLHLEIDVTLLLPQSLVRAHHFVPRR